MPDLTNDSAGAVDATPAATSTREPAVDAAANGVDAPEAPDDSEQQPTDLEEARRGRDEAKARARDAEQALDDARNRIAELEQQNQEREQTLERLQTDVRTTREASLRDRLRAVVTDDTTDAAISMLVQAAGVDIGAASFDADASAKAVRKHIADVMPQLIREPTIPTIPVPNNGWAVPEARKTSAI